MSAAATASGQGEREILQVPGGGSVLVTSGFYEGLELSMDRDWMVIGRGRSADIVIAEATISRAHAAIGYDRDGFFVQDLGSTNGTMVNGERIERQVLAGNEEIRMGRLIISINLPH